MDEKKLHKKIKEMMEIIGEKCQVFHHMRLEVMTPEYSREPECYVFFDEARPGRRLRSFTAEVALANVDIVRRKICSFEMDASLGGIRWAWIFDERVSSIVNEELAKLQEEFSELKLEIGQEFMDFSE